MKKYLYLSLILLVATFSMPAYAAVTAGDVLSKTANKINTAKSLTAKFTATAPDGNCASGTLIIARDKFSMTTPDYNVWYNGTDMWSFYTNSGEVSLTTPTTSELMEINPFVIVNQYAKKYKATIVSNNNNKYVISLASVSASNPINKATITISSATWLPSAIDVTFTNKTTLKIAISSITEGKTDLPKSNFEFPKAKFPKAEVIDLR